MIYFVVNKLLQRMKNEIVERSFLPPILFGELLFTYKVCRKDE